MKFTIQTDLSGHKILYPDATPYLLKKRVVKIRQCINSATRLPHLKTCQDAMIALVLIPYSTTVNKHYAAYLFGMMKQRRESIVTQFADSVIENALNNKD